MRAARREDAAAVAALWTEAYVTLGGGGRVAPYEEADFLETAENAEVFVAERGGAVVGVVALLPPPARDLAGGRAVARRGEAELSRLAVAASARGAGIGRALTSHCTQRARDEGWSAIALWSRPYQREAHRLYESLGYRRAPERDTVDESGHGRLVFRLTLQRPPTAVQRLAPSMEGQSVALRGGRRLGWRSLGSGAPLLLVNGYAATAADWDPSFVAALAGSFEVIRPDSRGVGDSDLGDLDAAPMTIASLAADLEELLAALEIERAPAVGWSMGGFVVQRLASQAPARVEAMALLSTDPGGPAAVPADPDTWAKLTDRAGTPREQASRLISLLFPAAVAAAIDRDFGDVVAAARSRLSPRALSAQEAAMAAWHREEQPLPDRPPPVLIAHGDADVVIPPANAAALADRWPGARVERFAGGGHAFMAQEPERLADLIVSFLSPK